MFKNYLSHAFKNIKKYKGYSFINLFGLSVGIACFIFMLLWIQDEMSFDRFHENADEIYRVVVKRNLAGNTIQSVATPNPLGPTLENEYPEIINFTRTFVTTNWVVQYREKKYFNSDIVALADHAFFEMFSLPFVKGNPKTALNDPRSLVITEGFAKKYFGNDDPMNKIVRFTYDDFKVTGVIKNVPHNSHFWFDCIFPIVNVETFFGRDLKDWRNPNNFYTYIQVRKDTSREELEKKISGVINKHVPETKTEIFLQPLTDIHLKSKFDGDRHNYKQGNIAYIYLLSLLALSILFIACFNYMNLSTARAADHAQGIALRKVVGASRMDIMKQFLGEAIILSFIALIFALILVFLLLPVFNDLANKHLTFDIFGKITSILGLIILMVVVAIIAGSYPALFLSSFQPIKILKNLGTTSTQSGAYFRKTLVILQFTVAIILILSTLVIYNQLVFLRTKPLGFNPHNVINFFSAHQVEGHFNGIKSLFMSNPKVLDFCLGNAPMFIIGRGVDDVSWEGKDPDEKITIYPSDVDYGYIELYQMELVEGRSFSKEFSTDASAFILNETAVKAMGLKSPVGKRLRVEDQEGTIIGVVKDYHHRSLHDQIMPVVLRLPYRGGTVSVRISPVNIPETLRFLENTWNKINRSPYPFIYNFADESIDELYQSEHKVGTIAQLAALITLLVSCLGLFGLTLYTSRQRTKEIGIRKVFGSSVSGIVWLISKEFMLGVMIAFIIACPLAWYVMNRWLQAFAYRVAIEWWMFVFTGVAALVIAFFTVSYQVIDAARTNPVDTLRYE
jgi:putative ABC transport system permease protein